LLGETEAAIQSYQKVIGLVLRDLPTSNALSSMGHILHVRGDYTRALDFYKRSIACARNNFLPLILRGCLSATMILSGIASEAESDSVDKVCASFRRGLFFLKGQSRWIGLLAYGEVVAYVMNDAQRAVTILWDAAIKSALQSVWPSIALVHFYQYYRCDIKTATRVFKRMRELRFKAIVDLTESTTVDDFVALEIVYIHLCMEQGEFEEAARAVGYALELDPESSPALRCRAMLVWRNNKNKALKYIEKSITGTKNGGYVYFYLE